MKGLLIVFSVNLLILIFRVLFVIFTPLSLSPEEAQYWDWSRHLDLSYYSKPPMVAYMNFVTRSLLGNTELAVRITPIVLSFLISLATYFFVKRIFDDRTAVVSSLLPNLFLGHAINSVLMTTDAPFIFFWALSVIFLFFAVDRNTLPMWLAVGIFSGLAFLSKYPAVFLLPFAVFYILLYRKSLLLSLKPYVSLLVAFILSIPVILWNIHRDFVSFKHVSALSSKSGGFKPDYLFNYLGGQALLLSVVFFFFLIIGWFIALKNKDKRLVFLTIFSLPVFLFFLVLSIKKEVYANWAGFGYFTGGILVSYVFVRLFKRIPLVALSFLPLPIFLVLVSHHTPLLDKIGIGRLLPPDRDPLKFLIGWDRLGNRVSELYGGSELVFSNEYQIAAELAFYVKGNPRTFVIHSGERRNQYDLWKPMISSYVGRDAIFVSYNPIPENILFSFNRVKSHSVLPVYWRGKKVKEFHIYTLSSFSGKLKEVIKGY